MDEALEDGELSGSESEMSSAPPAFTGTSFQSRAPPPAQPGYRGGPAPGLCPDSSNSDEDSSDDEAAAWRRKRQRVSERAPPPAGRRANSIWGGAVAPPPAGRRVNNIWGSAVQEQRQDAVAPPPAGHRVNNIWGSAVAPPPAGHRVNNIWGGAVAPPPAGRRANNIWGGAVAPPPAGRRVNNIWGSVVQEQRQDAVAAELGVFGMDGDLDMSRSVETYNYVLARKIMEKERETERQNREDGEAGELDAQLDEYMNDGGERGEKRKRPVKDRLGPKAQMDVKGRFEITEDDAADKVAEEIAHRLREPKVDLIERVVAVLGTRKALELLGETATLEESGGVFTLDGSRRRTPGGVFLNLLKNTPSVSKNQLRKIFLEETRQEQRGKKAAQKRRRHLLAKKMKQAIGTLNLQEHDDVSRETFASDTNEALEALEEGGGEEEEGEEPEEPEEPGPEPAAGTEDTPVVYCAAADLEVF